MPVYDVDGNGACGALSDGLLILRYAVGWRGEVLIADVIEGGSPRDTVSAIESYLAKIWWQTDVDGDGETTYTDALMILRYMFGFRGAVMAFGAVAGGATRTVPEIEAYIAKMVA